MSTLGNYPEQVEPFLPDLRAAYAAAMGTPGGRAALARTHPAPAPDYAGPPPPANPAGSAADLDAVAAAVDSTSAGNVILGAWPPSAPQSKVHGGADPAGPA